MDWPTIVDVLDAPRVSWKCYNLGLGLGSTGSLEHFNGLVFFKKWQNDQRLKFTEDDYHTDLQAGTLPQVSFLITEELYEHSSILKFIERRFGLPTLASVNHQFDTSTPGTNNDAAHGKPKGPAEPPRDGLKHIGDFYEAFDFTQNPNYYPKLPGVF